MTAKYARRKAGAENALALGVVMFPAALPPAVEA